MLPIQIEVGAVGGPVAGTTDWNYPAIAGVDGYLQRSGYGTMTYDSYTLLSGGGIHLVSSFFGAGEIYFFVPTGISYVTPSSNYTNGFNYAAVINALQGRIGWRNTTLSGYAALADSSNQLARSGRYYNDFHALVTIPNLKEIQDDPAIGAVDFNLWLSGLTRSNIMRCLNGVLNGPEYLEQTYLFDREGRNDVTIDSSNQFVGYEIDIAKSFDIAVQIQGATLQFNQDVTFNLYLFKDGKKTPVWINSVSAVAYEQTQVNFSDLILTFINSSTRGSKFYFGYFQSDLGTAKAIREKSAVKGKTLCFRAEPVLMTKQAGYTFDANQRNYSYEPYGLNLEMSSFRDWTQKIIKQVSLFDELQGLTMSYSVLELIVNAVRSNARERLLKDVADKYALLFTMDGAAPISDSPVIAGLKGRIDRELKRVKAGIYPQLRSQVVNVSECFN